MDNENSKDLVIFLVKNDYYFKYLLSDINYFNDNQIKNLLNGEMPENINHLTKNATKKLDLGLLTCKFANLKKIIKTCSNKNDWNIIKEFWIQNPNISSLREIYNQYPTNGKIVILRELREKYKINMKYLEGKEEKIINSIIEPEINKESDILRVVAWELRNFDTEEIENNIDKEFENVHLEAEEKLKHKDEAKVVLNKACKFIRCVGDKAIVAKDFILGLTLGGMELYNLGKESNKPEIQNLEQENKDLKDTYINLQKATKDHEKAFKKERKEFLKCHEINMRLNIHQIIIPREISENLKKARSKKNKLEKKLQNLLSNNGKDIGKNVINFTSQNKGAREFLASAAKNETNQYFYFGSSLLNTVITLTTMGVSIKYMTDGTKYLKNSGLEDLKKEWEKIQSEFPSTINGMIEYCKENENRFKESISKIKKILYETNKFLNELKEMKKEYNKIKWGSVGMCIKFGFDIAIGVGGIILSEGIGAGFLGGGIAANVINLTGKAAEAAVAAKSEKEVEAYLKMEDEIKEFINKLKFAVGQM